MLFQLRLFALHCLHSKCWTVKVIMEGTSLRFFYSFISKLARIFLILCVILQGELWPVEVAISLAKKPNWQTEIFLFFNLGYSEPLQASAYLLYPWTPFRHNDHRTSWTGAVLMELSPILSNSWRLFSKYKIRNTAEWHTPGKIYQETFVSYVIQGWILI